MAQQAVDVCLRVLEESNKRRFDNYSVRNSVLIVSHITSRACHVHIFAHNFLEIAVYNMYMMVRKHQIHHKIHLLTQG